MFFYNGRIPVIYANTQYDWFFNKSLRKFRYFFCAFVSFSFTRKMQSHSSITNTKKPCTMPYFKFKEQFINSSQSSPYNFSCKSRFHTLRYSDILHPPAPCHIFFLQSVLMPYHIILPSA